MAKSYSTISHVKIMKYLMDNADRTVNVNDIDSYLRSEGIEVNASTIYRFLNKLSDSGDILKYTTSNGVMSEFQYAADTEHNCHEHLHLKCTKCGKIIHLECSFMNDIKNHIAGHHGFELECESSVLYGLCRECKEAK